MPERVSFDSNGALGLGKPLAGFRVIIVLGPLELGGSERQALLFARYLKNEQGAEVHIWGTMGKPGHVAALCDEYSIPSRICRIVPNPSRISRAAALIRFAWQLRQARPDIILPYMEMPNLVCGLAWRLTGARLCVWNQRDDGIARIRTLYEPWAIRSTPRFISNSMQGAEHLVRTRSVPAERVRVIHNGVELARPEADRETWRLRLGLCDRCFAAAMVANLTPFKDHATLLRAWRLVVDRLGKDGRNAVLVMAGRFGETHDSLRELAHDLDLEDSVRFLGQVKDVSGLLGAVDAGVFCSNSEGSPNSVIEYMAAGLAVAGTDIPAMREALGAENHALLATPRDAEALAACIVKLATEKELCSRLGIANRRRAETEFSPRRMCEETFGVIADGLLQANRQAKLHRGKADVECVSLLKE